MWSSGDSFSSSSKQKKGIFILSIEKMNTNEEAWENEKCYTNGSWIV